MLLLTTEQDFFISEGLRIFFTFFVLFILHIPIFYKIILIIISDSIDCGLSKIFFNDWVDPNTNLYQISDKITDLVTYLILFFYILRVKYLDKKRNVVLFFLLFYRIVGEILFFSTRHRFFLLLFPNFFLETLFVFVGMKHFEISESYLPCFAILIVFWKLIQEYYLHIYKYQLYKN